MQFLFGTDGLQLSWPIKPTALEMLGFFSETKPYFIFFLFYYYEEDKFTKPYFQGRLPQLLMVRFAQFYSHGRSVVFNSANDPTPSARQPPTLLPSFPFPSAFDIIMKKTKYLSTRRAAR
jgi:hypothetical protein